MVGVHLRELVQQLEAIQGTPFQPMKLDAVLASKRDSVLQNGLKALDEQQIVALVRSPRLLIELQSLVLERGSKYWSLIPRTPSHTELANSQWRMLQSTLTIDSSPIETPTPSVRTIEKWTENRWLIAAVSLAAVILIAFLPNWSRPHDGRFFAARELQQSLATDGDYLKLVANQIHSDWKADLQDRTAFEKQLRELRDSCNGILARDLKQLRPSLAQDFKDRCRKWRDDLNNHLNDLADGKPLADVQTKSNALIEKLTGVLLNLSNI